MKYQSETKMDKYTRNWITENSINIINEYEDGVLTLRGLHYQLVGLGMTNTTRHYKRVVGAMIKARREGLIRYSVFSDHDREMIGETVIDITDVDDEIENAKYQIKSWMNHYNKNRWENQKYYVEVFIEKKALQGVFGKPCFFHGVALGACKGYPSLTFLSDTAKRYKEAEINGKELVLIYFGDYDPSGEDIPRSIGENLINDFGVKVKIERVALMEQQVLQWNLPPAPTKKGDSRTANWDGLGQVELDAVKPQMLTKLCEDSINKFFDTNLYDELIKQESEEKIKYKSELRKFVNSLNDE